MGCRIDLIEFDDLSPKKSLSRLPLFLLDKLSFRMRGLTRCSRFFTGSFEFLNTYDLIVACNDYVALGLETWKRKGVLKTPYVYFVMGMLSSPLVRFKRDRVRRKLALQGYGRLLENAHKALFFGLGELKLAGDHFLDHMEKMHLLPFGVDTLFWNYKPLPEIENSYFLFAGNDPRRDFRLAGQIAEALPEYQFVFLSSRMNENGLPRNVKLIKGNFKNELLSDIEVRDLYHHSRAVFLPITQTMQPSGQSVCLQAMACGRPVVISRFPGFWVDSDFVNHKQILFAGNRDSFVDHLKFLAISEKAQDIGKEAMKLIVQKYDIERFSKNLLSIISPDLNDGSE